MRVEDDGALVGARLHLRRRVSAIIVDDAGRVYGMLREVCYGSRFDFVFHRTQVWPEQRSVQFEILRRTERAYNNFGRPHVFETRAAAERALARLRKRYFMHAMAVVAGDGFDAPHAGKDYLRRVVEKMRAEREARRVLAAEVEVLGARIERALGALPE